MHENNSPPGIASRLEMFSDIVALLGATGTSLYFYSRTYSSQFLRSFGLPPEVAPVSVQDASADRLLDVAVHLVYASSAISGALLFYALLIVLKHYLFFGRKAARPRRRPRATWLSRRRDSAQADKRLQRAFEWSVLLLGIPVTFLIAVGLVGIAADLAAQRSVDAVRAHVAGTCRQCAVYTVAGKAITGLAIAGTEDRIFILRPDGAVAPIALDGLDSVRRPAA